MSPSQSKAKHSLKNELARSKSNIGGGKINGKTFLSAANILGKGLQKDSEKNKGNGVNITRPIANLASKILDYRVITLNLLRTRGFLKRKSMKKDRKWSNCFFHIQIPLASSTSRDQ